MPSGKAWKLVQAAGILVVLIAAICFFVSLNAVASDASPDEQQAAARPMLFSILLGASGIFLWLFGRAGKWWSS